MQSQLQGGVASVGVAMEELKIKHFNFRKFADICNHYIQHFIFFCKIFFFV